MARAYIVLCRNDLPDSLLQVLDLVPNATTNPPGQTQYLTWFLLDGVNVAVTTDTPGAAGGASIDFAAGSNHYGLSTYLLDNVEDTGGNQALTAAEAGVIAGLLETRASNGLSLNLAAINTAINTPAGVAGSDLNGVLGNSTGTAEEVLRILAGERYRVVGPAEVQAVGGTFVAVRRGAFVTRPSVRQPESVYTGTRPVRGRSSFNTKMVPSSTPVQTGAQDVNFNDIKLTLDTGHLHRSVLSGVLEELVKTTYTFFNGGLTYGTGGTALDLSATAIPVTGIHRAVTVYAADGTVIG